MNRALALARIAPIERLPQVYEADARACLTVELLDPHASSRREPWLGWMGGGSRDVARDRAPDLLFVYLTETAPGLRQAVLRAVAASHVPAFVAMPWADKTSLALAGELGVPHVNGFVPFASIAARTRLALHCSSLGLCGDMASLGVPQLLLPTDLEKLLSAQALAKHGAATVVPGTPFPRPRRPGPENP